MWLVMRKSAVRYYQSTVLSRQGLEGAFNRRTFSSLPLRGTDESETAEQHNGLAAFLPAHPRHDTDIREKHERWALYSRTGSRVDVL